MGQPIELRLLMLAVTISIIKTYSSVKMHFI